jgi:hypothetical protein
MNRQRPVDSRDRAATARYVAALSSELSALAHGSGLKTLGHILDMARLEAESAASDGAEETHAGERLTGN